MGQYDEIRKYFGSTPSPVGAAPSVEDIAKYIILKADVKHKFTQQKAKAHPSLMSRIFDILSRGNYAAAEYTRSTYNPDINPITAIWEGLSGKKKTTFQDVLNEEYPDLPKGLKAGLGLGLDIFMDPLTYVPLPIGKGLGKLGLLKEIKPSALEKTGIQKLLERGEPINPELLGLPTRQKGVIPKALKKSEEDIKPVLDLSPRVGFETSQPALPGFEPRLKLPEIKYAPEAARVIHPPKGQGVLTYPRSSLKTLRAADVLDGVVQNDPESLLRVLPMPKPGYTGQHKRLAEQIIAKSRIPKDAITPKEQVTLYKKALNTVKKDKAAAYKVYLAIESVLEARGVTSRLATGESAKLSDIINQLGGYGRAQEVLKEYGTTIREGSPTWQIVQALIAKNAVEDSPTVKKIVDKIAETKLGADLPDYLTNGFDKFLKSFGKATAKSAGVSPAGEKATAGLINFVLSTGKSRAQIVLDQHAKILDDVIANSKANPKVNQVLTRALSADLGTLPRWAVDDNKAIEFFMGRVATWWGQVDLRPLSLNAIGASSATAAARGRILDTMFQPFDLIRSHEALKAAQGIGQANTPETLYLANQIRALVDNVLGQASGSSVLLRSGVHLEMLNKWMQQYKVGFEFSRGKVETITGQTIDLSKSTDWLNTWKYVDIKQSPKVFLFKLQQAVEQATREKALFDELGERFGSLIPGKGFRTKLTGHPYIEGYYFTEDIAKQIPRVVQDWTVPGVASDSGLIRFYDRVLSMWKAGVTIYRPGHHIRNLVGDIYLGWMDGVNTVKPYMLAARVQKAMKGAYEDLADVDDLVAIGALSRGFSTPEPGQILFRNRSGVPFTAEQIAAVAHQKGLLEHARTIEDIIDLGDQGRLKPFGGRVQKVAKGASELNTHFTRLAHFIDKIAKSRGNNLAEIFESASRRTRKWHPTGLDLTDFEKRYLRRIIPFYSWIRKSTPLLLEGLVMNPGKTVIPAKGYEALQEATGVDPESRLNPFPTDQMFPQWLRAQGVGPISTPEGFLGKFSNQVPPGYVMGGVGLNPLSDLISQLESPGKTLGTSLSPGLQIPTELVSGRKLFTQEPITGIDARPGALQQYFGEQIPFYAPIQNIAGYTPFGSETKKRARSGSADREAFINWLTAAGIRGSGPYRAQARYEELAPGRKAKRIGKEQALEELRRRLGE